ncbi:hypothetical protein C8Q70DRAFT_1113535 [Cubamyces menziesii]|nr:hypothetical protein C8Q70DRAFT_1113535 [Cubamyces menziesii]
MLYKRIRYVVRFKGAYSEFFPDDIILLSHSAAGLQVKLDALLSWCERNGLTINVLKSFVMVFGPLPAVRPHLSIRDTELPIVESTVYVGVTLTSTARNIFHAHRVAQAAKARKVANAALGLESYLGRIPPQVARTLYTARVDPHLVSACTIDLDVDAASLQPLKQVQLTFVRRVLRLPAQSSVLAPLLDLGLWPLRYRRCHLAIAYARYLLTSPAQVPRAAFQASVQLAVAGHPTWLTDLKHALAALPCPVRFDYPWATMSVDHVDELSRALQASLCAYVTEHVHTSRKLTVWQNALLPLDAIASHPTLEQLNLRTHAYRGLNAWRYTIYPTAL